MQHIHLIDFHFDYDEDKTVTISDTDPGFLAWLSIPVGSEIAVMGRNPRSSHDMPNGLWILKKRAVSVRQADRRVYHHFYFEGGSIG